jgi:hypothetical protein
VARVPVVGETTLPSVTEVDLRGFQLRLGAGDLRGQRPLVRDRLIDRLLLSGRRFQQVPGARELLGGKGVLRFELGDIGLVEIDLRLVGRLFEQVEKIALFDLGALDKQSLFQKRADPGDQRHTPNRLDAADKFVRLGDLPLGDADYPDRRRPARHRLRRGRRGRHRERNDQPETPSRRTIAHRGAPYACENGWRQRRLLAPPDRGKCASRKQLGFFFNPD